MRRLLVFWLAAVAACGHASTTNPGKSQNRLAIAEDYRQHGNFDAAEKEARRALELDPKNHLAHLFLGMLDFSRAAQLRVILEYDDCLTGVDAEGLGGRLDQHLLEARKHYEDSLTAKPGYGEALFQRATVDLLLGENDESIAGFKSALENAGPGGLENVPLARAGLAWAYFQAGDMASAAAELRLAIRFQPGMCLAHYRLGRVYFARGDWDKALNEFREVTSQACPIQEAHLYQMKSIIEGAQGEDLTGPVAACVEMAPKSCVAAQCRALMP